MLPLSIHPNPSAFAVRARDSGAWVSASRFAELAGVKVRMAQKALCNAAIGKTWNGNELTVRAVEGRLGRGGKIYEVYAPSLPQPLYAQLLPQPVAPFITLVPAAIKCDPASAKRTATATWRLGVIRSILDLTKSSPERAAAIAAVVARTHASMGGESVRISQKTIYEWLKHYQADGLEGLKPCQRADLGKRRVLVTMKWDAASPLDEGSRQAVAEDLNGYVSSMWAAVGSGWKDIQQMSSLHLQKISKAAGWDAPEEELKRVCRLSRAFIEGHRKSGLLAVKDQDNKRYFDKQVPRITRHRDGLKPMDVVVGDVHPLDIAHTREDGSIVYAKAICWLDVATNRLHVTLKFCEPGKGVTQADIGESFALMCAEWGLPKTLYLDNGSEYSWHEMMVAFTEISRLAQKMGHKFALMELPDNGDPETLAAEERAIIRAKPYNAQAKPIEGIFSVIENTAFSKIPGWTGGDRMRSKTHNVGHAPLPHPGTRKQYCEDVGTGVDFYHQKPQFGTLDGDSPNSSYQGFINAGWKRTHVDEQVLLLAFADEGTRKADRGCLSWKTTVYYDDKLLPFTGQTLTVRVCRHDPRYAFVFDKDRTLICAAEVEKTYALLDSAGPKEQSRRNGKMNQYVSSLRKSVHYVDPVQEMEKIVIASGQTPQAQIGATVELSDTAKQMVAALEAKETAALEEAKCKKAATGANPKRLSQWSSPDEPDPYLDEFKFADEESAT